MSGDPILTGQGGPLGWLLNGTPRTWLGGLLPIHDKTRPAKTPYITWALIIINILAFLYQISADHVTVIKRYGFYPILFLANEQQYRLVTSMFLHGDLLHLLGNMLFLYIFGDNVEGRLGRAKYLLAYISLGVAASMTHTHSGCSIKNPRPSLFRPLERRARYRECWGPTRFSSPIRG